MLVLLLKESEERLARERNVERRGNLPKAAGTMILRPAFTRF